MFSKKSNVKVQVYIPLKARTVPYFMHMYLHGSHRQYASGSMLQVVMV